MNTSTIGEVEAGLNDGTLLRGTDGNSNSNSDAGARSLKISARRMGSVAFIGVVIVAASVFGGRYWITGRFVETTDDAYVKADSSTIAPKVSGYVARVLIDDNQEVRAGQILAQIDDADLRTALDQATATVSATSASIANLTAQLAAQKSVIQQATANVSMAHAAMDLSGRNEARRKEMARVGYGSDEQSDDASTDHLEKTFAMKHQEAVVTSAQRQVDVLETQRDLAQAQLTRDDALRRQAALNLSYATIRAPIDGTVGARSIRVGQFVQAGTQLMELVPLRRVYVIANFKETQLTHLRAGQTVRVEVDSFPGTELQGSVASLAPASGLEFALLPPDNATGNFTKIVQRVPVKIAVDENGPLAGRLRPGMSVDVAIDTKDAALADRQPPTSGGLR